MSKNYGFNYDAWRMASPADYAEELRECAYCGNEMQNDDTAYSIFNEWVCEECAYEYVLDNTLKSDILSKFLPSSEVSQID